MNNPRIFKQMITPEEFRDLTDALEGVGLYDPSVDDLFRHIAQSDVVHLDLDSAQAWTGWVGFSTTGDKPLEVEMSPKALPTLGAKRPIEDKRYSKAIQDLLRVDLQLHHETLAKTHGLVFELQGDGWGIQAFISLPKKTHDEYCQTHSKIIVKTFGS